MSVIGPTRETSRMASPPSCLSVCLSVSSAEKARKSRWFELVAVFNNLCEAASKGRSLVSTLMLAARRDEGAPLMRETKSLKALQSEVTGPCACEARSCFHRAGLCSLNAAVQ